MLHMPRRFQFSLGALLLALTFAAVIAARAHYNRQNAIARALSHLHGMKKLQAKISPVQPTWQGKQLVNSLRAEHEGGENRLKELRAH